jgi:tricorn protease
LHAVFVYSVEQANSYQLTDGMADALYVAFDKGGRYLYFTASTDVALRRSWLEMTSFQRPITRSVYLILLQKSLLSPLSPQSDGEKLQEGERAGKAKTLNVEQDKDRLQIQDGNSTAVWIDLEGIDQRTLVLPIPARNYYGLFAGKPGIVFLLEGPQVDPPAFHSKSATRVHQFDLKTRTTVQILDGVMSFYDLNGPEVTSFHVASNGQKMLYAKQKEWFIAPTESPSEGAFHLLLESMAIYVDPRAEWKHMYQQVWRDERDFFYDPNLHGLNLKTIEKEYEPYLEKISTRDDLNYLFNEMLGNITVSHVAAAGGDIPGPESVRTGLLGADYSIENGRYRFTRIYRSDIWNIPALNPDLNTWLTPPGGNLCPLAQPGVNVQVGDYLLAVNGRDVRPPMDVYSFFQGAAGKHLVLKVGPNPDGSGSREATVTPIADETSLRTFAWIEGNRRRVDELTGGRVAYVYLPNTGADGYMYFNRYYFAQIGKEAAIIDVRYNPGGKYADYIVDYLRRPLMGYVNMREGQDITTPAEAIFGPKVMIINESAGSGGDLLPWMFRKAGMGPLIGKRTWGGSVGAYSVPGDLLDGASIWAPNLAFYNPNGTWDVENHGVSPDVEVEDDPKAAREGHDPQLEKAVAVVLDLLKKNPPPRPPQHPPYPNYQHKSPY